MKPDEAILSPEKFFKQNVSKDDNMHKISSRNFWEKNPRVVISEKEIPSCNW